MYQFVFYLLIYLFINLLLLGLTEIDD